MRQPSARQRAGQWRCFGVAAVALAVIPVAGCSGPADPLPERTPDERPPSPLPEHLAGMQQKLLDLHNAERRAVRAPPLTWDGTLAADAARYGPALARIGRLEHASPSERPGQGENLWMGTRDRYRIERMFGGWAAEKSLFRPGIFPAVSSTPRWQDVAHYTQVIWRGTSRVGCAIHQAEKWDYLICRYAPPGNVRGRPVP